MANPLLQHYIKLTEFLGQALGPDYEVALHDMTDKNRSIVAIANNHISGREIGAPLTNVALKILMDKSYETQDYRLLGWTKDTDGTALAVYEQSGRLTDYLRDIYAATHGANNIQGYFYPSFYNGMDGYGRPVHIDAYFSTFPDEAGGWSAYLPTTGWEYDEQDDLWRSTYSTG